jgi:hypothetical protein
MRLNRAEPDTTNGSAVGVAGKQEFTSRGSILTRHGLHLRLKVLIRQVNIQRRRIGSEQLTLIQRPAPLQTIIALLLGSGPVKGGLISPPTPVKDNDPSLIKPVAVA